MNNSVNLTCRTDAHHSREGGLVQDKPDIIHVNTRAAVIISVSWSTQSPTEFHLNNTSNFYANMCVMTVLQMHPEIFFPDAPRTHRQIEENEDEDTTFAVSHVTLCRL